MDAVAMEKTEAPANNQHPASRVAPPTGVSPKTVAASQPFLALSSLGLAYGSLKSVMRRVKRATSLNAFKLPKAVRTIPKYMKSNYVKYPLLFVVFLAATRRMRAAINH